ncbi:MAG: hypothetical protein LC808_44925, partial [Actinobacteria bacterium]|nr:hypothetical protein [Actinomycetota bacterium]
MTAKRVAVFTLIGRADHAIAVGGAALDALAGGQHAELCLRLARTAVVAGRWAAAEDYVERSARPNDPRSLVRRADAAFGAGRVDKAAAIAAVAIERADDTGAYTSLCEALGVPACDPTRPQPVLPQPWSTSA